MQGVASCLKNFCRAPSTPHKKTPRPNVLHHLYNLIMTVKKSGIDGKAHETRVNAIATQNEHAFVRGKFFVANQAAGTLGKRFRDLGFDSVDDHLAHKSAALRSHSNRTRACP